jgi:hypothetical protein
MVRWRGMSRDGMARSFRVRWSGPESPACTSTIKATYVRVMSGWIGAGVKEQASGRRSRCACSFRALQTDPASLVSASTIRAAYVRVVSG